MILKHCLIQEPQAPQFVFESYLDNVSKIFNSLIL